MTVNQQSVYKQMLKSISQVIESNPTTISFPKYAKKDNGFGTMVIDLNSDPAILVERVKISHNVNSALKASENPIGLGEPYYNYILTLPCTELEENTIITEVCTGIKYRVHDIDSIKYAGQTYGKRAIIEDVK